MLILKQNDNNVYYDFYCCFNYYFHKSCHTFSSEMIILSIFFYQTLKVYMYMSLIINHFDQLHSVCVYDKSLIYCITSLNCDKCEFQYASDFTH